MLSCCIKLPPCLFSILFIMYVFHKTQTSIVSTNVRFFLSHNTFKSFYNLFYHCLHPIYFPRKRDVWARFVTALLQRSEEAKIDNALVHLCDFRHSRTVGYVVNLYCIASFKHAILRYLENKPIGSIQFKCEVALEIISVVT